MQKRWDVMVVPISPSREVLSFNLSSRSLWTAAVLAVSLFVLALAALLYTGYNWQQEKLEQVSKLESELDARDTEFSKLNREFSVLEELEDKLRTIAGLKPRDRSRHDTAAGGQGGPSDWDASGGKSSTLLSANALRNHPLRQTTQELFDDMLDIKDSFAEVLDVFDHESARLSSIPSINPVASQEAWISSGFGYRIDPISGKRRFHEGADIVAPRRTPIIAPADGTVTFAGWRAGLGRTITIQHGYGYITTYGHNEKLFVKKGDLVKRGDLVAHVGSSGRSTGPHLHYEIRLSNRLVNPYKYLVQ